MFDLEVARKIAVLFFKIPRKQRTIPNLMEAIVKAKNDKDYAAVFRRDPKFDILTAATLKKLKTGTESTENDSDHQKRDFNIRNTLSKYLDKIEDFFKEQFLAELDLNYRDHQIEADLTSRFPIRYAVVIKTQAAAKYFNVDQHQGLPDLHKALGQWGHLVFRALYRPGDIIGVGTGRGVSESIRSIAQSAFSSQSPCPAGIVSLTGTMSIKAHLKHISIDPSLDADHLANQLTEAFITANNTAKIQTTLVSRNVAQNVENPRSLIENLDTVNIALLGIGALTDENRLKRYGEHQDITTFSQEIVELTGLVKKMTFPMQCCDQTIPYCPVGDVCNRLITIQHKQIDESDMKRLQDLTKSINKKIVAPELKDFEKIAQKGAVIAVAGSPSKAMALWRVLAFGREDYDNEPYAPLVSHVVTDDVTAKMVIAIDDELKHPQTLFPPVGKSIPEQTDKSVDKAQQVTQRVDQPEKSTSIPVSKKPRGTSQRKSSRKKTVKNKKRRR